MVECQILLTPKEGIYKSGDPVIGTLIYKVMKSTVFEEIYIHLNGEGKVSWSEGDSDSSTDYYGKEQYVSFKKILLGKEGNVVPGVYKHPFEFYLPENIPSSFKDSTGLISYKIEAVFKKTGLFATKKFDTEIPFYGDVNPTLEQPLIFGVSKSPLSLLLQGPLDVKIEIEKTFLMPGENIKLKISISNNSDVLVKEIRSQLATETTYISDSKHKKVYKFFIKETKVSAPGPQENSKSSFSYVVPTLPNLYSIQHSEIILREYKLHVEAVLPFPHRNASVELPVVIGERNKHFEQKPSTSKTHEEDYVEDDFSYPDEYFDTKLSGK